MFSTRLKTSNNSLEHFLVYDLSDSEKGCVMTYSYPATPEKQLTDHLPQFLFPCEHKSTLPEEYTLVFTDKNGKFDFVVCLYLPMTGYVICAHSHLPCFEFLHYVMMVISQKDLHHESSHGELTLFLQWLLSRNIMSPKSNDLFTLAYTNGLRYPFAHRFVLEYYTAISSSNWVAIFENILLERSIVFHSTRFQRLTSCILASLGLIYPLVWAHLLYPLLPTNCIDFLGVPTPFIAGVPSCIINKTHSILSPGVVIVDIDDNTVYVSDTSDFQLPNEIRRWLLERCESTHRVIRNNKDIVKENWAEVTTYICQPFLETMALLMLGYRDCLYRFHSSHSSSDHRENSTEKPQRFFTPSEGMWQFNSESFVQSRGPECSDYLQRLLRSQMFIQFIDSRLDCLNSDAGMVPQDVFEDCADRVSNILKSNSLNPFRLGRKGFDILRRKLAAWKFRKRPFVSIQDRPSTTPVDVPVCQLDSSDSMSNSDSHPSPVTSPIPSSLTQLDSTVDDPTCTSRPSDSLTNYEERSLVDSVFMAVPDIPSDWLLSFTTNSNVQSTSHEPVLPIQNPACTSRIAANNQSPLNATDFPDSFDPYALTGSVQRPTPQEDDLALFLRQLDPLLRSDNEHDLLK